MIVIERAKKREMYVFLISMLTENVFNVGAMKRETLHARFVIRYVCIRFSPLFFFSFYLEE